VAQDENRLVAVAWYCTARRDPKLGLIGHIYTQIDYRKRGISRRLVEAAMADFRDRGGLVMQLFSSTPYTIPFYERIGFENLYANQVYHTTDWYMRHPVDSWCQIADWYAGPTHPIRPLSDGDLPHYCLLTNLEHEMLLKDRAQSIGLGLEAEFAFIRSMTRISKGEGCCFVLENDHTIVGMASLTQHDFPHHAHVAVFDLYLHPQYRSSSRELADACLACRDSLGTEIVYALVVDESKHCLLTELGFRWKARLPEHYKIGTTHFDCELMEYSL
jgi:ribosomal protein S18 acetylase RimI-like enzyme